MPEKVYHHHREGGKLTHCGCEILPNGKDILSITINRIEFKYDENVGGNKQNGFVAIFDPNPYTKLSMWLNATNKKRLLKLTGLDYLEKIKNFPVRLTKELARDPAGGGKVDGLRISLLPAKNEPAKQASQPSTKSDVKAKIELTKEGPDFVKCKGYLDAGGEYNELLKRYSISEEVKLELIKK